MKISNAFRAIALFFAFSVHAQQLDTVVDWRQIPPAGGCTNCPHVAVVNLLTNDPRLAYSIAVTHDGQPSTYTKTNLPQWALWNPLGSVSNAPKTISTSTGASLPQFDEPGGNASCHFMEAWAIQDNVANHIIAMLDFGVDGSHPELTNSFWSGTPSNYLFSGQSPSALLHGTEVAGIIAASSGDGVGIAGAARKCQLFPILATTASAFVRGVDEAIFAGAREINFSGGFTTEPAGVKDAILRAAAADIVIICAARNGVGNGDGAPDYPASWRLANVIVVGGSTVADTLYSISSTNIDLAAPARLIVTTVPVQHYSFGWNTNSYTGGTSMACAFVTSAVALCREKYPSETCYEIIERIMVGVDTNTAFASFRSKGRLNAYRSLLFTRTARITIENGTVYAATGQGLPLTIETSQDLETWQDFISIVGTGFPQAIDATTNAMAFYRARP